MNRRALHFFARVVFVIAAVAFAAATSFAQNDAPPPAQSPTQSSSPDPAPPAPAKKVWTNEDMHSAATSPPDSNVKPAGTVNKPKPNAKGKDAGWYRTQISKLQAQIPPLDEKISQLQAALNGQTVASATQTWDGAGRRASLNEANSTLPAPLFAYQHRADGLLTQVTANGVNYLSTFGDDSGNQ